jgi:hypothetical protein
MTGASDVYVWFFLSGIWIILLFPVCFCRRGFVLTALILLLL